MSPLSLLSADRMRSRCIHVPLTVASIPEESGVGVVGTPNMEQGETRIEVSPSKNSDCCVPCAYRILWYAMADGAD